MIPSGALASFVIAQLWPLLYSYVISNDPSILMSPLQPQAHNHNIVDSMIKEEVVPLNHEDRRYYPNRHYSYPRAAETFQVVVDSSPLQFSPAINELWNRQPVKLSEGQRPKERQSGNRLLHSSFYPNVEGEYDHGELWQITPIPPLRSTNEYQTMLTTTSSHEESQDAAPISSHSEGENYENGEQYDLPAVLDILSQRRMQNIRRRQSKKQTKPPNQTMPPLPSLPASVKAQGQEFWLNMMRRILKEFKKRLNDGEVFRKVRRKDASKSLAKLPGSHMNGLDRKVAGNVNRSDYANLE